MLLKYKATDKLGQPVTGLVECTDIHCMPSMDAIVFSTDSALVPGIIFTNLNDAELKVIANQLFEHGKIDMSKFSHAEIIFDAPDEGYIEDEEDL